MIKCIISDLDGTLLSKNNQMGGMAIHPEDVAAVKRWEDSGGLFAVATGRDYGFAEPLEHDHGIIADFVASNGGAIYIDEQVIHKRPIPGDVVVKFLQRLHSLPSKVDYLANLEGLQKLCDDDPGSFYNARVKHSPNGSYTTKEYIALDEKPGAYKISVNVRNMQDKPAYWDLLNAEFANELTITSSGRTFLEVNGAGVDKASGLEIYLQDRGLEHDEVAVIGDEDNDLTMLQAFKYSFAMASGNPVVIETARYVVGSVREMIDMCFKMNGENNAREL